MNLKNDILNIEMQWLLYLELKAIECKIDDIFVLPVRTTETR